jgi:ATP-dependent DNA helicase RecG
MDDGELLNLLSDLESDRVERKESISESVKIREAICAFANDMPNHRKPGVIFIGAKDNGSSTGLKITDELLLTLSDMRSDGNILPIPSMTVQKRVLGGCDLAVVEVIPSDFPPVRYKGRVWIRVGPRRAVASPDEERRLVEKRKSRDLPFDLHPIVSASLSDLDLDLFKRVYLPAAVDPEVLLENNRSEEEQLASLRFITMDLEPIPTVVGILTVGRSPTDFIPGAYIQFLRIDGRDLSDPISDQKRIVGPLPECLKYLDLILSANIRIFTDIVSESTEIRKPDYPLEALQQLTRNAVMHRDYMGSNAPVRLTWFSDRVEIQNPGGPFGQVTCLNFGTPGVTDYRNPSITEAMRSLGFVQKFGVGILLARKALHVNQNPPLELDVQQMNVRVIVRKRIGG